jgi:2'-5' RNA ligase
METDERIRAFVALDLPDAATAAVAAWQRSAIADRSDLRPIRPEALHLTLAFLGHVETPVARRAADVVEGVAAGSGPIPLRLVPEPLGIPRRRPRVVAFDLVGPAAVSLAEDLAARLAGDGVIEAQHRRFRLHLSVARVRGSPRSGGRGRRLTEGLPPLPEEAGHTFGAVRIALYRSRLGPGGASYTALTAFELPPLEGAADEVI